MRAGWLVHIYPARWRARYGNEFRALLEQEPASPGLILDIVRGALVAHATPLPSPGGLPMNSHTRAQALASLLAVVLVLPALTFLGAAAIRLLQPRAYEPSRTAWAIFDFVAGGQLPYGSVTVLLVAAPLVAFVLGLLVAWRRLATDGDARADLASFAGAARRVARHPTLLGAGFAVLASAAVLLWAIDHAIAG